MATGQDAAKERHAKRRAKLKEHFSKSIGKTTFDLDKGTVTTTNKGFSITRGLQKKTLPTPSKKVTSVKPSKKQPDYTAKDKAHTKSVAKVTAPEVTTHSAASKTPVPVPKGGATKGNLGAGLAVGAAVAAAGVAAHKLLKPKAPKSKTPHQKRTEAAFKDLPERHQQRRAAEGAKLKEGLAKLETSRAHDARRAKQGTDIRHATEAAKRADARAQAKVSEAHETRRAKQGAELRHSFEAAERADARKVAAAVPEVKAPKTVTTPGAGLKEAEARAKGKTTGILTQERSMAEPVQEARAKAAVKKAEKGVQHRTAQEAVAVHERREADRRGEKTTRRGRGRKGTHAVEGRDAGPRRSTRRKAGERRAKTTVRNIPDASKMTNAQLQAEIEKTKAEIAAKKKAGAKPQTQSVAEATAAKPSAEAEVPVGPKKDGIKIKEPKTVSEQQRKRATNKFYNEKNRRIAAEQNKINPQVVTEPTKEPASAYDKNVKRQAEIVRELETKAIAEGPGKVPEKPVPTMKDPKSTAERFGTTEAEIAKVARKIDPVEAPEKVAKVQDPETKRIMDRISEIEAEIKREVRAAEGETRRASERKAAAKPVELKPNIKKTTAALPSMEAVKAEQAKADVSPPKEPARERGRVTGPKPKRTVEQQFHDRAERHQQRQAKKTKPLTSPALEVAGEKAKDTAKREARVRAAKGAVKAGGIIKAGGLASVLFAALGGTEAAAKEHDPKKRVRAGVEQFKASVPSVAKEIAEFTAKDYAVSKLIPEAVKKVTGSKLASGLTRAAGRGWLAFDVGKESIPFAVSQAKELATQIGEGYFAKHEAAREKKASEAKYGTIEAATKTRHAKEAYKKAQAKNKGKDLLTG